MMLKRTVLIVLAAGAFAFAAGCSSEDDGCTGDECIASPGDPGTPFDRDTPDPQLCDSECAHLQGCSVINDLECVELCANGGLAAAELECLGNASCRGAEACLDLDPSNPFGD